MANVSKNPLLKDVSGKFGDHFVYKTRGKKTTMARMPTKKEGTVKTENQLKVNSRFNSASKYAKGAVSSEALKKEYQKKVSTQNTAFNIAFRDFLKAPQVTAIDTQKYTGAIGSTITVNAVDDFKVAAVKVSIYSASGVLIEEGDALVDPIYEERWKYTVTQLNSTLEGTVIKAIAMDLPENTGTLSVTL
jgi:hypothetical protein